MIDTSGGLFMGGLSGCEVAGQQIELSSFRGVIEDIQSWTTHQTWSEGGGGYVHPQYGGYVQAPVIRSRSTHHIRVRVAWDTGRKSTIDLPGQVQLSNGDQVTFVAAENRTRKFWQWAGVVNHTTETWFAVGVMRDIAQIDPRGLLEWLGRIFFKTLYTVGGQAGGLAVLILGGLLSVAIAAPLAYLTSAHSRHSNFGDLFWLSAVIVAVATFIGSRKLLGRINAAETQFQGALSGAMKTALAPR